MTPWSARAKLRVQNRLGSRGVPSVIDNPDPELTALTRRFVVAQLIDRSAHQPERLLADLAVMSFLIDRGLATFEQLAARLGRTTASPDL
jgi:hypothetical protein